MLLSYRQNAGKNHIKIANRPFSKYVTVEIFGSDSNKSKFDSGGT
jgi:hypothetical protein